MSLADAVAEAFEGERARVSTPDRTLEGQVAAIDADEGAVLLRDARDADDEQLGTAYLTGVRSLVEAGETDAAEELMDRVTEDHPEDEDDESVETTPAIQRVETDEAEESDEAYGDEDLVIVGTGSNGMSKYHRDELCAYAARLKNPRERPLSVLGDAEPCSNCCPEAEDSGAVGEGEDVDLEAVRTDAGPERARMLDVLEEEGELPGPRIKTLTEISGQVFYDHLNFLKDKGAVEARKDPEDGRRKLYSLAADDDQDAEEGETVYVTSGHKNVFHRDEDCERAQRSSNVYERSELQVDDLEECTFCGGGEADDTQEGEDGEDADESIDDLLDGPEPDGDEEEVDDADQGDADEVPEYRSCSCGETFADSLEYYVHRTEDHGKPQQALGHLEPDEFEETVNDVDGVQELADELGFSTERTLRILNVYGLEDAVGPGDVEISNVNDFEFDGVVDDHDVATGEFWCGFCGEGPLDTEAAVREHHQDEGHAGEAAIRSEDPSIEVENASTSRADGGVAAIMSSTDGPGQRCQNCDSHVTKHYARIHAPEGEEEKGPRVCPNCEDKVREGDGTVREARAPRRASGNGGPS